MTDAISGMLGKGKAVAITEADIARLADNLQCHPADLEAIAEVESNGFGWFADGRIKILFEKHWFYKYIEGSTRDNAVRSGLARKAWISPAKGGYADQASADDRYRLFERAIGINREGAFKSISMGKFQIMGFNHTICGHQTAEDMFNAFCESEVCQLAAFASFLMAKGLVPAIQRREFDKIEKVYNGGGLNGAYAKRMHDASDKLRAGKWADYMPGSRLPASAPPIIENNPVQPRSVPTVGSPVEQGPAPAGWLVSIFTAIFRALRAK